MIWGLIIFYIWNFIGLLMYAHMHGKPRDTPWNFWVGLTGVIIELVLFWWALGWRFI